MGEGGRMACRENDRCACVYVCISVSLSVCVSVCVSVCLLVHGQGQRAFLVNGELHDDQWVAGLPLLEGWVYCKHKVHLPLVQVGQEELPADHLIRDLVVVGLAMQLHEGGVGSEVVPAPARRRKPSSGNEGRNRLGRSYRRMQQYWVHAAHTKRPAIFSIHY